MVDLKRIEELADRVHDRPEGFMTLMHKVREAIPMVGGTPATAISVTALILLVADLEERITALEEERRAQG